MSIDIYSSAAMDEDINEFSSLKVTTENKEKSKYTIKFYKYFLHTYLILF